MPVSYVSLQLLILSFVADRELASVSFSRASAHELERLWQCFGPHGSWFLGTRVGRLASRPRQERRCQGESLRSEEVSVARTSFFDASRAQTPVAEPPSPFDLAQHNYFSTRGLGNFATLGFLLGALLMLLYVQDRSPTPHSRLTLSPILTPFAPPLPSSLLQYATAEATQS